MKKTVELQSEEITVTVEIEGEKELVEELYAKYRTLAVVNSFSNILEGFNEIQGVIQKRQNVRHMQNNDTNEN